MMHTIVWTFLPARGREAEFTSAYGPDGDWARLFRRGRGYVDTSLEPAAERPGWFRTVDRWESRAAYLEFRRAFEIEYAALDELCEALTAEEHALTDVRIETARLLLRELRLDDAPALNEVERDPRVARYVTFSPRSLAESEAYLDRSVRDQAEIPRRVFDLAIAPHGSDSLIGRCGLSVAHPEHRAAMIWYLLAPAAWGKGLAFEAARAVLEFGFRALGLHRVWADCDPRNTASCRLAERLGMLLEGLLRENYWLKGEWCGTALYGILENEWRGGMSPRREA